MVRTIWKFPISLGNGSVTPVAVTDKETILHTDFDPEGTPCVWVEVDTDTPRQDLLPRRVITYYTGTRILEDALRYLGTLQRNGLVYHVYTDGKTG